jgi:signal transduction histidine kinase
MIPYYNVSTDGVGFPGFLNYVNTNVDGWFSFLWLIFIWIVIIVVGMKSEYKPSSIVAFACFMCFILSWMLSLIMTVNNAIMFLFAIGTAIALAWSRWGDR